MKILGEVIKDLFYFAVSGIRLLIPARRERQVYDQPLLSAPASTVDVQESDEENDAEEADEAADTFQSTAEILAQAAPVVKNAVMYVGEHETPLCIHPTKEFDGVTSRLPYGAMVMLLENNGRWARVAFGESLGWVLREQLVDRAVYVHPQFIVGDVNEHDDPCTVRLRAMIDDMFGGAFAKLPLHAGEYVQYRLLRRGVSIPWGNERPRTSGSWHVLLAGVSGVHISVHPKVGAVMEYTHENGVGHLAYVESVFPDDAIAVSECNYPHSGIYNERVIPRSQWVELKPVFLEIS